MKRSPTFCLSALLVVLVLLLAFRFVPPEPPIVNVTRTYYTTDWTVITRTEIVLVTVRTTFVTLWRSEKTFLGSRGGDTESFYAPSIWQIRWSFTPTPPMWEIKPTPYFAFSVFAVESDGKDRYYRVVAAKVSGYSTSGVLLINDGPGEFIIRVFAENLSSYSLVVEFPTNL